MGTWDAFGFSKEEVMSPSMSIPKPKKAKSATFANAEPMAKEPVKSQPVTAVKQVKEDTSSVKKMGRPSLKSRESVKAVPMSPTAAANLEVTKKEQYEHWSCN